MKRLIPNSQRCTARNTLGLRCSNSVVEGTDRCESHPQCTATTHLGNRCNHTAIKDTERCQFHKVALITEIEPEPEALAEPFSAEDYIEPPVEIRSAKDFAKAVLESLEFREYIVESLKRRTISASIILRLMDYADDWGRPPERVEHTGKDGEPIITEVKRIIVHTQDETPAPVPSRPVVDPDALELQGEDLDIPMLPVPPRRMH